MVVEGVAPVATKINTRVTQKVGQEVKELMIPTLSLERQLRARQKVKSLLDLVNSLNKKMESKKQCEIRDNHK